MQNRQILKQRLLRASWFFLCWTSLGFFSASQVYIRYTYNSNQPTSWRQALSVAMPDWYAWAMLSPLIFAFARRFPIDRDKRWRRVFAHLGAGLLFSSLKIIVEFMVLWPLLGLPQRLPSVIALQQNLLVYAAIIGMHYAFAYYRQYREHEVKASQLEAQLAQAQLQALKMQLHPHFLFNTLHAISTLVHKDAEAADRMIARLSDLLRLSLDNLGEQEVSLQRELEFLQRYLEIEQIRFGDRLSVQIAVAPETLEALVPNLILQPLVENAIRHGIAPHAAPGRIEIQAKRENHQLRLGVRDNGGGLPSAGPPEGVGLTNTRARLQQLYGSLAHLKLINAERGLLVELTIPWRCK